MGARLDTLPLGPFSYRTEARFWEKVDLKLGCCWTWRGHHNGVGYGMFNLHNKKRVLAHRVAYTLMVGPIPEGLALDHLCRNRGCVNPIHMEPVTIKENILRGESNQAQNARKTHCSKGHPLTRENLDRWWLEKKGWRICLICKRERAKRNTKAYQSRQRGKL